MMKSIFAVAFLFSSVSFATTSGYELKVDLSIDGKLISSPRIITIAGEKASISQRIEKSKNGTFIEVIAKDVPDSVPNAIRMDFVVGTIDHDGKKTVLATPSIITLENEKAMIETTEDNGKSVALSVIPQRKSLQD